MVYIKRVSIKGFKTFGKKVSLNLDKGLTVITGPNGSGKSNIVDAVRFALGELSPKEMRGTSLGDLIFKSSKEQELKSASVTIQFDNSDRRIPIDADTITISREYTKSGEGVYRINGKRTSRKQLTELLSSAGIQLNSFNIIPQHAVTKLAEVSLDERRKIIEDMIGITAYDARKAEAEEQLQKAEVNIKIASARMEEVKARLEALEKERNELLRSRLIKKEVNLYEAKLVSNELKKLEEEIRELNKEIEDKKAKLKILEEEERKTEGLKLALKEEIERGKRALEEGNLKLLELEEGIGKVNAQLIKAKTEVEAKESELKSLMEQKRSLEQRLRQISRSILNLNQEIFEESLQEEKLRSAIQEKSEAKRKLAKELKEAKSGISSLLKRREELSSSLSETLQAKARIEGEVKSSLEKLNLMKERLEALKIKEASLTSSINEAKTKLEGLLKIKNEKRKELVEVVERLGKLQKAAAAKREEARKGLEALEKAKNFILKFKAKKATLQTAFPEKLALSELEAVAKAGALKGIYGRLRNMIKFDKVYEKAVEAASSGWLDALVVEDGEAAALCLKFLKENELGRVKILPLRRLSSRGSFTAKSAHYKLKPLKAVVNYQANLEPAVDYAFGDTFLLEGDETPPTGIRVVSLDGDVFEPEGAVEGGYYRRRVINISAITEKINEVRKLESVVKNLEEAINWRKGKLEEVEKEIEELKKKKNTLENQLRFLDSEKVELKKTLAKSLKEASSIREETRQLAFKVGLEEELFRSLSLEEEKLDTKVQALRDEMGKLKGEIEACNVDGKEEALLKLDEEIRELQRSLIEVEKKISLSKATLRALKEEAERIKPQLEKLEKRIASINEKLNELRGDERLSESKFEELRGEKSRLAASLSALKVKVEEQEVGLKKIEEALEEKRRSIYSTGLSIKELLAKVGEKSAKISFLTKELNKLGYDRPVETSEGDMEEIKEAIRALKEELKEIGAVNELAEAHYREYKESYKQLSTRINELEEERMAIINFMREIDREKREAFMKAFNKVNANFQEVFSKVSNGGSGKLVLENPDDPFRGGVDMLLMFPGKAELSVNSASGGEKSVATICFILALQTIRPMPFYLFDEIDAHLDALNSSRLAELLRERSAGAQFIVISLKDVTISKAHRVYGIFVQGGSSRIVALPTLEA
ncbi:TPA: chromosome segregation protein SMC [Candidatus Bathyarchaeota archaeon]|nr:chromosome segregation protein SMC [Candidatus Bathyarchaeota archaeon]